MAQPAHETPEPPFVHRASEGGPPRDTMSYARALMKQQDWYRAISELKRYRYFEAAERAAEIERLIGLCYLHGGQHVDAYRAFGRVLDDPHAQNSLLASAGWRRIQAAHLGGASLLITKDAPGLTERFAGSPASRSIAYLHGFSHLQFGRWAAAAKVFSDVAAADPQGDLGVNAAGLVADLRASPRFHPKSPALAGALALAPGLGHVYAERYSDAWNALLPNAVLLTSTGLLAHSSYRGDVSTVWPAVVGTVALAFYAANIYSAINVTRQGNQLIIANEVAWYRQRSLLSELERLDVEPGGSP